MKKTNEIIKSETIQYGEKMFVQYVCVWWGATDSNNCILFDLARLMWINLV